MPADDLDERGLPARIAGWVYGIVLGLLLGLPFGVLLNVRGPWLVLFAIGSMFAAGYTVKRITTVVPEKMANAFLHLIWPSGSSTPYSPTYSYEQSLVARGDVDGALSRYRLAMGLHPGDAEPRLRAAELLFRSGTPGLAVPLFNEARRLSPAHELYATQRLIDLYIGPLKSDVKALSELRRVMDRFPGTPEAESAQRLFERIRMQNV
jgi:hypothetical protein